MLKNRQKMSPLKLRQNETFLLIFRHWGYVSGTYAHKIDDALKLAFSPLSYCSSLFQKFFVGGVLKNSLTKLHTIPNLQFCPTIQLKNEEIKIW